MSSPQWKQRNPNIRFYYVTKGVIPNESKAIPTFVSGTGIVLHVVTFPGQNTEISRLDKRCGPPFLKIWHFACGPNTSKSMPTVSLWWREHLAENDYRCPYIITWKDKPHFLDVGTTVEIASEASIFRLKGVGCPDKHTKTRWYFLAGRACEPQDPSFWGRRPQSGLYLASYSANEHPYGKKIRPFAVEFDMTCLYGVERSGWLGRRTQSTCLQYWLHNSLATEISSPACESGMCFVTDCHIYRFGKCRLCSKLAHAINEDVVKRRLKMVSSVTLCLHLLSLQKPHPG